MPESHCPLVERIARVLAGAAFSSNAEGSDPSAGEKVDLAWREHMNQALAVLHTMREPDETMELLRQRDPAELHCQTDGEGDEIKPPSGKQAHGGRERDQLDS